ncbi:AraC family transcriptional regulator [Bacillus salacetis]|uniref:AraC family transcriptional regulator n=1 Tax=Bacillus salacetis TaxID=2315464 RepID=A0A3A1R2K9_9BACI|nr:effector binding domain-containing protein [Bacillus salacetis]RIW33603.1 AraC family transcriptional regulator [Bacillus salacetis]
MEKVDSHVVKGVTELKEMKLIGFRVVCEDTESYGREIPKAFVLLDSRRDEIKNLIDPVKLIGAFKVVDSPHEDDGYWVCFEVNEIEDIPEGMVSLVIPAQIFGVLHFQGHASQIFGVYSHLHQWLDEKGYRGNLEGWNLEIYSRWSENDNVVNLYNPIIPS